MLFETRLALKKALHGCASSRHDVTVVPLSVIREKKSSTVFDHKKLAKLPISTYHEHLPFLHLVQMLQCRRFFSILGQQEVVVHIVHVPAYSAFPGPPTHAAFFSSHKTGHLRLQAAAPGLETG